MSLFPSFKARRRQDDSVPQTDAAAASQADDPLARDWSSRDFRDAELDENVFNLLPPESSAPVTPEPLPEAQPQGSNHNPVDMTDLSRLSIDQDGKLYWDGKPVETHHRLAMSRKQIIGACIVAAFIAIGAIGAAIQGASAARDWACHLGWSVSACTLPGAPPRSSSDIPA